MKGLFQVILSVVGGMIGAALLALPVHYGATVARTTITNPWTFATTTAFSAPVTLTTGNTSTSTLIVGCIQTYATSTATPVYLALGSSSAATTTYGTLGRGSLAWQFGSCPK